jgi:hypothetical protein
VGRPGPRFPEEITISVWHDSVDVPVDALAALHDTYVWDVNAAVAEGRNDLVGDLADDYFERSVRLMMGQQPAACGRLDCMMCATLSPAPGDAPASTHPRWWHRLHR